MQICLFLFYAPLGRVPERPRLGGGGDGDRVPGEQAGHVRDQPTTRGSGSPAGIGNIRFQAL